MQIYMLKTGKKTHIPPEHLLHQFTSAIAFAFPTIYSVNSIHFNLSNMSSYYGFQNNLYAFFIFILGIYKNIQTFKEQLSCC